MSTITFSSPKCKIYFSVTYALLSSYGSYTIKLMKYRVKFLISFCLIFCFSTLIGPTVLVAIADDKVDSSTELQRQDVDVIVDLNEAILVQISDDIKGQKKGKSVFAKGVIEAKELLGINLPLSQKAKTSVETLLKDRAEELGKLIEQDPAGFIAAAKKSESFISKISGYQNIDKDDTIIEKSVQEDVNVNLTHGDDFQADQSYDSYQVNLENTGDKIFILEPPVNGLVLNQSTPDVEISGFRLGDQIVAEGFVGENGSVANGGNHSFMASLAREYKNLATIFSLKNAVAGSKQTISTGTTRVLFLVIDFKTGHKGEGLPADFQLEFSKENNQIKEFYRKASYGKIKLDMDVFPEKYDIDFTPVRGNQDACIAQVNNKTIELITRENIDISSYDILYTLTNASCGVGGWSGVGPGFYRISGVDQFLVVASQPGGAVLRGFDFGTTVHELGHSIGSHHASRCVNGDNPLRFCRIGEYGNPYDPMGSGYLRYDFGLSTKGLFDWVNQGQIINLDLGSSGIYKVFPLTLNDGKIKGLKIGSNYWVEYRRDTTSENLDYSFKIPKTYSGYDENGDEITENDFPQHGGFLVNFTGEYTNPVDGSGRRNESSGFNKPVLLDMYPRLGDTSVSHFPQPLRFISQEKVLGGIKLKPLGITPSYGIIGVDIGDVNVCVPNTPQLIRGDSIWRNPITAGQKVNLFLEVFNTNNALCEAHSFRPKVIKKPNGWKITFVNDDTPIASGQSKILPVIIESSFTAKSAIPESEVTIEIERSFDGIPTPTSLVANTMFPKGKFNPPAVRLRWAQANYGTKEPQEYLIFRSTKESDLSTSDVGALMLSATPCTNGSSGLCLINNPVSKIDQKNQFDDVDVAMGNGYFYRILGKQSGIVSGLSNVASIVLDIEKPRLSLNDQTITLSWPATYVPGNGDLLFKVYRSQGEQTYGPLIASKTPLELANVADEVAQGSFDSNLIMTWKDTTLRESDRYNYIVLLYKSDPATGEIFNYTISTVVGINFIMPLSPPEGFTIKEHREGSDLLVWAKSYSLNEIGGIEIAESKSLNMASLKIYRIPKDAQSKEIVVSGQGPSYYKIRTYRRLYAHLPEEYSEWSQVLA